MFFKKKYIPRTKLQINDKAWQVSRGEHQDKPLLVRINTWAKELVGHPELPFRIGIAVPFLHPQADGLPTGEENFDFNEIEDAIFDIFQKNNMAIVCVTITTNGMREFLIYSSVDQIEDQINQLKSKFSKYNFQHYISEDKKWDGYNEWLG